jgi:sigma-E factor negative regulatory protein RseA
MKEQLSAMMDDQGDRAECERCLDRLKEDGELRLTWEMYHLIGDAMRDTGGGALSESFASRLAAEPTVIGPRARPTTGMLRGPLRYALPLAASIAAVAFVAWVGLPQLTSSPIVEARNAVVAPVATAPVVPVAQDVGDYLLAHQRYSPSSAMSGVAPYVRTVSESTPAR